MSGIPTRPGLGRLLHAGHGYTQLSLLLPARQPLDTMLSLLLPARQPLDTIDTSVPGQ